MLEFWEKSFQTAWNLFLIYAALVGGVVVLGLAFGIVVAPLYGFRKLMERWSVASRIARVWARVKRATITFFQTMDQILSRLGRAVWEYTKVIVPIAVFVLALALVPWIVVGWAIVKAGVTEPLVYATGSLILSVLVALTGWIVVLILDLVIEKKRPDLRAVLLIHPPLVVGVAIFWLAPFLAVFPLMAVG